MRKERANEASRPVAEAGRRSAQAWAYSAMVLVAAVMALLVASSIASAQTEVVEYYHHDAVGSVRAVTNEAGQVIRRYDYMPFGELWQPTYPIPERRLFTGQERDHETGLDYFGARYYRADIGRFTTVDPGHVGGNVFDPQSWNAYAYARNNPLKYVDPTGLEYEVCAYGASSCGYVSDRYFEDYLAKYPGRGISLWEGWIFVAGSRDPVGWYQQISKDPTFDSMVHQAGSLAAAWLKEEATNMAVGAATAAVGGIVSGVVRGGLAMESLSVTGRLGSLKYGKAAGKLARQMAARGWTDDMIREAVASGQKVQTVNKATGNLAIRYIHPRTGQSIVIDTVTKEIIHVGGPGFLY